ncbi:MAG: hypothetical protein WD907_04205 [Bacilli bacterium]
MIKHVSKIILAVIVLCGFTFPNVAYSTTIVKSKWEMALYEQVNLWIDTLIKNDERFDGFKSNTFTTRTLGPNMKQWLLTFKNNEGLTTGYLVVGGQDDKQPYEWVLLEYGLGEYALFNEDDEQVDIHISDYTPIYHNPFELYWLSNKKSVVHYRHHLSYEEVPVDEDAISKQADLLQSNQQQLNRNIAETVRINERDLVDPFDYVFWLVKPPLKADEIITKLQSIKDVQQPPSFVFESTSYNGLVQEAFTVTGYHKWNNDFYISIEEQDIIRFIPSTVAEQYGNFFVSN